MVLPVGDYFAKIMLQMGSVKGKKQRMRFLAVAIVG